VLAGARCLAAIGEWTSDAPGQHPPPGPSPPGRSPHRAVAVDGKTMRGSGHHDTSQLHLLAVMDHTTCGVLGLTGVDGKANEITRFQPPPNHAPATPPAPWPACAASPSASCGGRAIAISPPCCGATPATPHESCHSSASPGPSLCAGYGNARFGRLPHAVLDRSWHAA